MKKPDRNYWDRVLGTIADHVEGTLPSVTEIGRDSADPFKVLISTVISLRTKDKVTLESSLRLFARAGTAEDMLKLDEDEIASLIYPAGFYKTKAKNIKEICSRLNEEGGIVPQDRESLLSLPGVGLKTANLVLSQGWGIPAICVDIHVHRIANRMGWSKRKKLIIRKRNL